MELITTREATNCAATREPTSILSNPEGSLLHSQELQVAVNLRPTFRRPVCPGVRRPSGTRYKFFFLLEISFRQLWLCYFVAPSLTKGRVCNLLYNWVWALPEQSLLGRSPAELTTIFYCLIWDSLNLEVQVPAFISPRNSVAYLVIPPGTGFHKSSSRSDITTDSQSASSSWCLALLGAGDQMLHL
jgi:hypothetical protein